MTMHNALRQRSAHMRAFIVNGEDGIVRRPENCDIAAAGCHNSRPAERNIVDGADIMTWVTQGPIADRTRERLVSSDQGIALLRRTFFEQLERVEQGLDPLGVVRDPEENRIIELPQERDKYRDGHAFLAESLALSNVRYSPLREQIVALMQASAGAERGGAPA